MTTEPPTPPEVGTSEADRLQVVHHIAPERVPTPTAQFRRGCWLAFQRALDPLAPPRPPRLPRH